jgi:transposase
MNDQKRFPEEFKIAAFKQITEWGYRAAEDASQLALSQHSLYAWLKRYGVAPEQRAAQDAQSDELRKLKAKLKRATEERDIPKKMAAAYIAKLSGWRLRALRNQPRSS